MKQDRRLSGVLHLLLHMATAERPVTSEALAKMMHTNPVVVRRILAGLRKRGLVRSEKGHGGGWRLVGDIDSVTLHDIYVAIGSPSILAIGNRHDASGCLVEEAVNRAMNQAFEAAEALLLARFQEVTLATLSNAVHPFWQGHAGCFDDSKQP